MVIAIISILFAVALFLIFYDDHDRSYTRNEPKSGRENGRKSVYQKSTAPRRNAPAPQRTAQAHAPKPAPNPVMGSRTIVPEEKQYRPQKLDERFKPGEPQPKYASAPPRMTKNDVHPSAFAYGSEKALDFSFLEEFDFDPNLPEKTMSSFIAGLQGYCTRENLGGVIGYIMVDPVTGAMEVHDTGDGLMGYQPGPRPLPLRRPHRPQHHRPLLRRHPHRPPLLPRLRRRLPPRLPGVIALAQEGPGPNHYTGLPYLWRRHARFLAQVNPILGAGGVFGGGPAPQNGLPRTTVAQVPALFLTCANIPLHLRQESTPPAPTIVLPGS